MSKATPRHTGMGKEPRSPDSRGPALDPQTLLCVLVPKLRDLFKILMFKGQSITRHGAQMSDTECLIACIRKAQDLFREHWVLVISLLV